jgi:hypothetical protein
VSKKHLNDADVDPALQKVGGEAVPVIPSSELAALD